MAVSRALRRLLLIRNLEEEQRRLALEEALGERNRLEHALGAAAERDRRGRRLVQASAESGQLPDRIAGLEETRAAIRHARAIEPRIEAIGEEVAARREEFLLKRVERRQAETLIRETEAREAIEAGRRGQQALDDWFSSRIYRVAAEAEPRSQPALELGSQTPKASVAFPEQVELADEET
ncbi:MAG: hypothetical protein ABSD44_14640 [Terracidiphilus sp.]